MYARGCVRTSERGWRLTANQPTKQECMGAWLLGCLHVCLHTDLHAHLHPYVHICLRPFAHKYARTCARAHPFTHLHPCMYACLRRFDLCTHASMHASICAQIRIGQDSGHRRLPTLPHCTCDRWTERRPHSQNGSLARARALSACARAQVLRQAALPNGSRAGPMRPAHSASHTSGQVKLA